MKFSLLLSLPVLPSLQTAGAAEPVLPSSRELQVVQPATPTRGTLRLAEENSTASWLINAARAADWRQFQGTSEVQTKK
ncbi:hypothetical protein LBMAG56_48990 [Verrucomicrobiota bacterium]|nr:hypothetical protein LBMAG56_48990 [Verrucomicrobiota bacterium]